MSEQSSEPMPGESADFYGSILEAKLPESMTRAIAREAFTMDAKGRDTLLSAFKGMPEQFPISEDMAGRLVAEQVRSLGLIQSPLPAIRFFPQAPPAEPPPEPPPQTPQPSASTAPTAPPPGSVQAAVWEFIQRGQGAGLRPPSGPIVMLPTMSAAPVAPSGPTIAPEVQAGGGLRPLNREQQPFDLGATRAAVPSPPQPRDVGNLTEALRQRAERAATSNIREPKR
jgi:hypothetical protein